MEGCNPPIQLQGEHSWSSKKGLSSTSIILKCQHFILSLQVFAYNFWFVYKDHVLTIHFPTALCPVSSIPFPFIFFLLFPLFPLAESLPPIGSNSSPISKAINIMLTLNSLYKHHIWSGKNAKFSFDNWLCLSTTTALKILGKTETGMDTIDLNKSVPTKELLKAIIRQWERTASFEDHISYLQDLKKN